MSGFFLRLAGWAVRLIHSVAKLSSGVFICYNHRSFLTAEHPSEMKIKRPRSKRPVMNKARIIRSVASSTAVETGESIQAIESRLKAGSKRFQHLNLAS